MESPRHYYRRQKLETTPVMQFGTYFHEALLEPEKWEHKLKNLPEMPTFPRKSKNQPLSAEEQRENWVKNNPEYIDKSRIDFDAINEMVLACRENDVVRALLDAEDRKVEEKFWYWDGTILWTGQVDVAVPQFGAVCDVKTTVSANSRKFDYTVDDYLLNVQAVIYKTAMETIYGNEFNRFVWIAVEKKEPFCVVPFFCDFGALEIGKGLIEKYVPKFLRCLEKDTWPGYSEGFKDAGIPHNRMYKYEDL
jgi:exodeoxyribonuclease VIII